MTKEQKELHRIAGFLDHFTDIYDEKGMEIHPIPSNIRITVFCQSTTDEGYLIDTLYEEMGLELLVAKSWILQSELDELYLKTKS